MQEQSQTKSTTESETPTLNSFGEAAGLLASRLRREALVPGGIECAPLVVRRDDLADLVAQAGHLGDSAAGHELHVVGVRDGETQFVPNCTARE